MSRTSRRAGLGGLVAVLVLVGLAVPAWAYFSVTSTVADAGGRAAALGTPGVATSGVTASTVTFTVSAPTGGPTPSGYRVARTSPSPVATVCTVTGANGACTDAAPVSGQSNTYAVYAVLAGTAWESPAPRTTSVDVPSADNAAPVTTATQSPAANGAGWNKTDVTVTLSATDASGVAGTWYSIDGTNPTTAYTAPFVVSSTATVRFYSKDTLGNTELPKQLALKIDKVAPTVSISSPTTGSVNGGTVTITGSAADTGSSSLASVVVQYRFGNTVSQLGGSPTYNGTTWSWSWPTSSLPEGSYTLIAIARDNADNATPSTEVPITLKNTFTVTAPATATAGTPFNVTVSTYPGYTGAKPISVTGLQAGPSGAPATVPTNVTFTNGTATFPVTPVRSGSQSITVTDSGLASMTGTSSNVVVTAGAAARLAWTTVTAQGVVQPTTSCYFTCGAVIGNNTTATARVSITDEQGNIVTNLGSTRTVTVSAPNPGGGTPAAAQVLTVPATGAATSSQWSYSDSGNWTSHSFTATSGTLTQATLTVGKNSLP